jgi:hypothetical protein
MVSAVALRRATSISAGWFSRRSARALISSLKVAEKSRLCFFAGTMASTFLMSWMKPMSSMRSASSSTKISTWLRSSVPAGGGRAGGRAWPPGCRRRAQLVDLRLHADAAEHHHAGQRQVYLP